MKKIAILIDNYFPGNINQLKRIINCKKEYEKVIIIVNNFINKKSSKELINSFRCMRKMFYDDSLIEVLKLEKANKKSFSNIIHKFLKINKYTSYNIFVSIDFVNSIDNDLKEKIIITNDYLKLDPNNIKNWNQIMATYRKDYCKNFLVYGTASTGKSNLVKDIAKIIDCPYGREYCKDYEYKNNILDNELEVDDFVEIALGQYNINKKGIYNNKKGIFIADTDVMTTKVYLKQYLGKKELKFAEDIFNFYIRKQKWEKIFIIPPITDYINDGFRDMSHADKNTRENMHNEFVDELKQHNLLEKTIFLDDKTYKERYSKMLEEINKYLA